MKTRLWSASLLLFVAKWLAAESIPQDVRAAFEQRFFEKRSYLVVVQKGIPTTSVYGVNGNQTQAYYSIDVFEDQWKTSQGLLDTDQVPVDFLERGEVLELASVSFKDNRIDLRAISVEAHKVSRSGGLFSSTKREPVSTNFKFFLPYPKSKALTRADLPTVFRQVETYLKPFPNETAARAFSARLLAGQADAASRADAPARSQEGGPSGGKKEIKAGMTPLEVIDILGRPKQELVFGNTTKWTYPDLTVLFENGKVKEVRF